MGIHKSSRRCSRLQHLAHQVETQLETIRASQGVALEAVHVAAHELCEACDRCEGTVLPTVAFFNGKQFLCPDCTAERGSSRTTKKPEIVRLF